MAWDASMAMLASPSNSTPSARFAVDTASGLKARLWVEEVIGRRLPEGDFAAGFKDGVGLCELLNAFKAGLIAKIEHSKSPFHQMANISCFLRAIRALGVREQVMFETLVRVYLRTRQLILFSRVSSQKRVSSLDFLKKKRAGCEVHPSKSTTISNRRLGSNIVFSFA